MTNSSGLLRIALIAIVPVAIVGYILWLMFRPFTHADQNIAIVFTANTHACFDPSEGESGNLGGILRRIPYMVELEAVADAGFEQSLAKANPRYKLNQSARDTLANASIPSNGVEVVLWLDCGSFIDGSSSMKLAESEAYVKAMDNFGLAVVNLGVNELKVDSPELYELTKKFRLVVSANVENISSAVSWGVADYYEAEEGYYPDLFITGVTTAEPVRKGTDILSGFMIENPAAALSRVLANARQDQYVIVMVNGLSDEELRQVRELEGIDILLGMEQSQLESQTDGGNGRAIELAAGEDRGRELVRGDFRFSAKEGPSLLDSAYIRMTSSFVDHVTLQELGWYVSVTFMELQAARDRELARIDRNKIVDFVGEQSCMSCHADESESHAGSRHATSMDTLQRQRASTNSLCLPCHSTGYGKPTGHRMEITDSHIEGVSCEACHGPGELHVQLVQGDQLTGPMEGLNELGLTDISEQTCTSCHNDITDGNWDFAANLRLVDHDMPDQKDH
ncbi:hypothetical protein KDL44_12560 [bacterium]|nr:hypothetical protein [bacterium]